jgi:hypothetical protein
MFAQNVDAKIRNCVQRFELTLYPTDMMASKLKYSTPSFSHRRQLLQKMQQLNVLFKYFS